MYVGGILSHIVIGAVMASDDAVTMSHIYHYKEMSAYILILPGLALKIVSDLILYFRYEVKPNWLKELPLQEHAGPKEPIKTSTRYAVVAHRETNHIVMETMRILIGMTSHKWRPIDVFAPSL